MPKIDLGRIGAVVQPNAEMDDIAVELEKVGYATIWTGGPVQSLEPFAELVRATERVRVASGIISVDRFSADEVSALYSSLEATHPGRFVVGLGGAHGANPLATLNAYIDRLHASVPVTRRILAALGPRMLELARRRTSGAFPVLVTPEYTASARRTLGADATLAVDQMVVVADDAAQARAAGRGRLGFLGRLPFYQANFRRMGFTEEEIDTLSDRLVDALIPWGDPATVAGHIERQLEAGADHVAVGVITDAPVAVLEHFRAMASVLVTS